MSKEDDRNNESSELISMSYLRMLFQDRNLLANFPNFFLTLDSLLEKEISSTREKIYETSGVFRNFEQTLPDGSGTKVVIQEKIYAPNPPSNVVGHLLGPEGSTTKYIEECFGVRIMVRGKGSMRDRKQEEVNFGKPSWEHLNDRLHILIMADDYENRVHLRIEAAKKCVQKLIEEIPDDDLIKQMQLIELASNREFHQKSTKCPSQSGGEYNQSLYDMNKTFLQANVQSIIPFGVSFEGQEAYLSPSSSSSLFYPGLETTGHPSLHSHSTGLNTFSLYYPSNHNSNNISNTNGPSTCPNASNNNTTTTNNNNSSNSIEVDSLLQSQIYQLSLKECDPNNLPSTNSFFNYPITNPPLLGSGQQPQPSQHQSPTTNQRVFHPPPPAPHNLVPSSIGPATFRPPHAITLQMAHQHQTNTTALSSSGTTGVNSMHSGFLASYQQPLPLITGIENCQFISNSNNAHPMGQASSQATTVFYNTTVNDVSNVNLHINGSVNPQGTVTQCELNGDETTNNKTSCLLLGENSSKVSTPSSLKEGIETSPEKSESTEKNQSPEPNLRKQDNKRQKKNYFTNKKPLTGTLSKK